jgi:hypothetical protein
MLDLSRLAVRLVWDELIDQIDPTIMTICHATDLWPKTIRDVLLDLEAEGVITRSFKCRQQFPVWRVA